MLTCDEALLNISRFLDNDLNARAAGALAEHLCRCAGCRHEYDRGRAVRDALNALPAPQSHEERAAVRERVFARLEQAARLTSARQKPRGAYLAGKSVAATFAAAALVGAACLAPPFFAPASDPLPGAENAIVPIVPLPGPSEMNLLYRLHDAHGERGLAGDDPIARRDTAAEAHAALLAAAQAAVAENL